MSEEKVIHESNPRKEKLMKFLRYSTIISMFFLTLYSSSSLWFHSTRYVISNANVENVGIDTRTVIDIESLVSFLTFFLLGYISYHFKNKK